MCLANEKDRKSRLVTKTLLNFDNDDGFRRWRDEKLDAYPNSPGALMVEVKDPARLSDGEFKALQERIAKANMALYAAPAGYKITKETVRAIDARFGLRRVDKNLKADEDGITSLRVREGQAGKGAHYIPYSNRAINWHTDGYYNPPDREIRAMSLHCACQADEGGGNALFDPDIAYMLLREKNPQWARALCHPQAMTIPANEEEAGYVRPAQSGPVFSLDPRGEGLHMRFTARTRSIQWRDDTLTRQAVSYLIDILNGSGPYVFRHRMQAGQGLICNNVLHNRTAFTDAPSGGRQRLLFRARYPGRINFNTPDTQEPSQ
jgi:alpha-ketoglutarate-dependent taurine dioxygenase